VPNHKSQKEKIMSDPTIKVLPKGPYLVEGKITLLDGTGKKVDAGEKIALCRCGASTNKPFCDGTHSKIGFDAAAAAVPGSAE
jgi:CDGSH-type Zn-finger protein